MTDLVLTLVLEVALVPKYLMECDSSHCKGGIKTCLRNATFCCSWQGKKNNGFNVLYHNMKYGLDSTKEFEEFLRERYAHSLLKI